MTTIEKVRDLVAHHREPPDDDESLALKSLELVMLTEALEDAFGIRVRASEVVHEHFGSITRIAAFVEEKQTA